jgi:ferredoxin-NADP reductase/nitrite reductase/ring-hydroxylating ferredoxin subunit
MSRFQKVAKVKDLKEGSLLRIVVEGKPIVLAVVRGNVHAIDAVCSHEGGPLEDGSLEGYELKCPWHYALFDVRNAKVSEQTVWATDLHSYPVMVDEASGDIAVSPEPRSPETRIRKEESTITTSTTRNTTKETKKQSSSHSSLALTKKEKLEGTDIMTFKFAKNEYPEYKAGQFAFFPLDTVNNDSKGPVRHFSLASSPTEDILIISTRIRDSPYKQHLSTIQEGLEVNVSKAQGNFVLHEDYSKPAVFLSGGIGVTPFRSMIKYATDKQLPLRITMFDSNRNQRNILYKDEFDKWVAQNQNLKIIYTITEEEEEEKGKEQEQHRSKDTSASATEIRGNWNGERGRIDRTMIERHVGKEEISNAIFYICGPPAMINALKENLLQKYFQVPEGRIKVEEFTGY